MPKDSLRSAEELSAEELQGVVGGGSSADYTLIILKIGLSAPERDVRIRTEREPEFGVRPPTTNWDYLLKSRGFLK